jgi:hypothetical protein
VAAEVLSRTVETQRKKGKRSLKFGIRWSWTVDETFLFHVAGSDVPHF